MHPDEFWRLTPAELSAVFVGARKQRDFWYELGTFIAWNVARFSKQAEKYDFGPFEAWSVIQHRLRGTTEAKVEVDWKTRKAQRTQQMEQFKKHEAQRTTPPRKRRG